LLGAGAAGVALGVALLPPADLRRYQQMLAMEDFPAVEKHALDTPNAAVDLRNEGRLSDLEFAERIDREVLPPWRAFRGRLGELPGAPPGLEKAYPSFLEYLQARQESWELTEKALRTGDPQLAEAAFQKNARAEQLVRELNK
jgi:hypothetical protein